MMSLILFILYGCSVWKKTREKGEGRCKERGRKIERERPREAE